MSHESGKIRVELHCPSQIERDLLEVLGASRILIVRSVDSDGNHLHLEL